MIYLVVLVNNYDGGGSIEEFERKDAAEKEAFRLPKNYEWWIIDGITLDSSDKKARTRVAELEARLSNLVGKVGKSRYEPHQLRLLERLANQIGNEGTLFHEISSEFKSSNAECDELKARVAELEARR